MHKIGLKLWSNNLQFKKSAQELYNKGYYQYIELYIVPKTYENHAKKWSKLKIPFIIHAPHFSHKMNLAQKHSLENNLILIKEAKKFADLLNSEIIIFHPGIYGEINETINQLLIIKDSRICLENKPHYVLKAGMGTIHSPKQTSYVLNKTNVGFCYDIGHGFCSSNSRNVNIWEDFNKYLKLSPKMFHLTDGNINGIYDQHLHLRDGNFDFNKITNKIPIKSMITIESYKNFKTNLNDFKKDCQYFLSLFTDSLKKNTPKI